MGNSPPERGEPAPETGHSGAQGAAQGRELIAGDGAEVKALREAQSLTRFAICEQNTAFAAHLGLIESGQIKSVRLETLERLCRALMCRPTDIKA
jgi:hypothetical protein